MSSRTFMDDPHGRSDRARQALLDNRCERLHPKRHRTQKRAKAMSAKKRLRIKHRNAVKAAALRKHKTAVRAYWAGETDAHPASPFEVRP